MSELRAAEWVFQGGLAAVGAILVVAMLLLIRWFVRYIERMHEAERVNREEVEAKHQENQKVQTEIMAAALREAANGVRFDVAGVEKKVDGVGGDVKTLLERTK